MLSEEVARATDGVAEGRDRFSLPFAYGISRTDAKTIHRFRSSNRWHFANDGREILQTYRLSHFFFKTLRTSRMSDCLLWW